MLFVLRILRKPWRSSAWSVQLVLSCCAVFAWAERSSFFRLRLFGGDVSLREAPAVNPKHRAARGARERETGAVYINARIGF